MRSPMGHAVFTLNDSAPTHSPGELVEIVGSAGLKRYKYVNYDNGTGNLTCVVGNLAYFLNSTSFDGYTVTMDVSDTKANMVAGVFLAVLTDAYYGWIQTWGQYATLKTNADDDISAGDMVIPSAAGDGTCDSTAAGTAPLYKVVGPAIADDVNASDTVSVYLTLE